MSDSPFRLSPRSHSAAWPPVSFRESHTALILPDIVDWMPDTPTSSGERDETVGLGEYTASKHMSVSNGFAAQGLNLLSKMVGAGGRADNATRFATESASLMKNMREKMWNGTNWCDGICSEVKGASLMMSNMFMLCFGMTPTANVNGAWKIVADWGLEKIGDYGAFWYQMALASGYYGDPYDTPDDGSAILTALTKCDRCECCPLLLEFVGEIKFDCRLQNVSELFSNLPVFHRVLTLRWFCCRLVVLRPARRQPHDDARVVASGHVQPPVGDKSDRWCYLGLDGRASDRASVGSIHHQA
eukprot:SAG11_NODE_1429_length_4936_cov_5.029539_2_plen_301_part_00